MASTDDYKKLLFEHGFVDNPSYAKMSTEERRELLRRKRPGSHARKELLNEVNLDVIEDADDKFVPTGYPESASHFRLVHESPNSSLEEGYFWTLEHMRQDRGFFDIIKITDAYASSSASALWGNQQQRITAQQNQAQGLLANIGKFVKELFQMVRELRIIDERLDAYNNWRESESADVTLKSIFTDQVEGGTKNPQSIFGLAQNVGFTILPDLFFNTKVYDKEELDAVINDMSYNQNVKNVLRRKLYQFITWKEKTHQELRQRRSFNLKYLRQHWGIIKMYMNWAKPALRNIKQLQMREDLDDDPELINSFDTNLTEVEVLAKHGNKVGDYYPVLVLTFKFRTRPEMSVRKEYQQGPAHMGRLSVDFRSYAWTDDDIKRYKAMREQETWELLGLLDESLTDVMEALGDDFKRYLDERFEEEPEYDEEKKKKPVLERVAGRGSALEPFGALIGGFADIAKLAIPTRKKSSGKKSSSSDKKKALGTAKVQLFLMWHIYKKAHRMISW